MSAVVPRPDELGGTRNCELAALLVTLGFEPVDDAVRIVSGHGVPGGKVGKWRFLPRHPRGAYELRAVLARGLDARQAGEVGTPGCPVYAEQAYIAAGFHNYRMLVERLTKGTRLELVRCGFVFLYQRAGECAAGGAGGDRFELPELVHAGTRRTELAAALGTLGFEAKAVETGQPGAAMVSHECVPVTWMLPARSADGRYDLAERMARWADDAWCGREDNRDPIACLADAFWNLRHLRKGLKTAAHYVRLQNGGRSVTLNRNASKALQEKALRFLCE